MKYILPILILVLASCHSEKKEVKPTTISGLIQNAGDAEVKIKCLDYEKTLNLSADGSFNETLQFTENATVIISSGRQQKELYLLANQNNEMTLDAEDIKGSFELKSGALIENQLKNEISAKAADMIGNSSEFYSQNEADFLAAITELKNDKIELITNSKANKKFKDQELRDAENVYQDHLTSFERAHQYYAQDREFKVSAEFNALKVPVDINNTEEYKNSAIHRSRVLNQIIANTEENMVETEPFEKELLNQLGMIKSELVKSEAIHEFTYIFFNPSESLDETYAFLKENTNSQIYLDEYAESYTDLKKLAKGSPSPNFTNYENHSGGVTSLADLKGKYVYVDVWATWCGPCKAEIPSLKTVEKQYHDKNIEFVSTSVDALDDHDKWKEFVSDQELSGVQLMADQSWDSEFIESYKISGIPRFILIDPNGNIVSADAPRPSDPGLLELFSELNL